MKLWFTKEVKFWVLFVLFCLLVVFVWYLAWGRAEWKTKEQAEIDNLNTQESMLESQLVVLRWTAIEQQTVCQWLRTQVDEKKAEIKIIHQRQSELLGF